jgi:hypothetical protein
MLRSAWDHLKSEPGQPNGQADSSLSCSFGLVAKAGHFDESSRGNPGREASAVCGRSMGSRFLSTFPCLRPRKTRVWKGRLHSFSHTKTLARIGSTSTMKVAPGTGRLIHLRCQHGAVLVPTNRLYDVQDNRRRNLCDADKITQPRARRPQACGNVDQRENGTR